MCPSQILGALTSFKTKSNRSQEMPASIPLCPQNTFLNSLLNAEPQTGFVARLEDLAASDGARSASSPLLGSPRRFLCCS